MKNHKNIPKIMRYQLLAAVIAVVIVLVSAGATFAGVIPANSVSKAANSNNLGYSNFAVDELPATTSFTSKPDYDQVRPISTKQATPFMHVIDRTLSAPVERDHFVFRPGNPGVEFYFMLGRVPEETYSDMAKRYHYHDDQKIDFVVYTDRSKFLQESPSRDAIGYAIPSENKIAVLLDGSDYQSWQSTIAHEINHIIFIRSVPDIKTVPQWFIEGLAIYESHPGPQASAIEEQALAKDLPDIISNRPNNSPAELKDYGQGYLLVGFIVREFGREALDGIIGRLQQGDTFNNAVLKTVKMSPEELNSRSRAYVDIELFYIWLLKLQDFEWYFATVLFLLAGGLAFHRKRKGLKKQAEDEQDDDKENEFDGVDFGDGAIV